MLRGDAVGPREQSAEYAVSQLNLAAFLVLAGHRLLRLEPVGNGRRFCQFIFERDSRIAEDRMRYYEGQASVDARGFAEALLELKRKAIRTLEEIPMNAKPTQ
jgi:hypothetical protein